MNNYYSKNAAQLLESYERTSFESVHKSWLHLSPDTKSLVLDIGSGSGRDAAWFADKGHEVVAVEPEDDLRTLAQARHPSRSIRWIKDSLPALKLVENLDFHYNIILLSGVWMHIAPGNRERAFRKIADLLKPGGFIVLSSRQERPGEGRGFYTVDYHQLDNLALSHALEKILDKDSADVMGREGIIWNTVVYRMP